MTTLTEYRKQTHGTIKAVDRTKREIEFVASRQEVDRDGEVMLARGIDTQAFMKNPVLLLDHDRFRRFGRVDSLRVSTVDGAEALIGRASIVPPGVSAEADQAYAELLHGALNGVSIGFRPLEIDPTPILPGQRGQTFRRAELLEISLVTLPACPSCVVTAKRFGRATAADDEIVLLLDEPDEIVVDREEVGRLVRSFVATEVPRQVRRHLDAALEQGEPVLMIEDDDGPTVAFDPADLRSALAEVVGASVTRAIGALKGRVD